MAAALRQSVTAAPPPSALRKGNAGFRCVVDPLFQPKQCRDVRSGGEPASLAREQDRVSKEVLVRPGMVVTVVLSALLAGCADPSWYLEAAWNEELFAQQQADALSHLPGRSPSPARETATPQPQPSSSRENVEDDSCPPPEESRLFDETPTTWSLNDLPDGIGPLSVTIAAGHVTHLVDALDVEREVTGGAICEDADGHAKTSFSAICALSEESSTLVQYTFELTLDRQETGSYFGQIVVTHLNQTICTSQAITLAQPSGRSSGGGGGYTYIIYY